MIRGAHQLEGRRASADCDTVNHGCNEYNEADKYESDLSDGLGFGSDIGLE